MPWAWQVAALPALYFGAALLYRYERHLPPWLARLLSIVSTLIPSLRWLKAQEDMRRSNHSLVRDLNDALDEFDLGRISQDEERQIVDCGRLLSVSLASHPTFRDHEGRFVTERAVVHEEARSPDAYLINFHDRSGPAAYLIDCLLNKQYASALAQLGISLKLPGDRFIYRFGDYTRNTRMGIVPKGMPFHEFYEAFAKDMQLVLQSRAALLPNTRPLVRVEVTLERIDLPHCHELWFGEDGLGHKTGPPSICNVWEAIEPRLDPDERKAFKPMFHRVAGGPGCRGHRGSGVEPSTTEPGVGT